jgi:hypothetical protein
MNTYFKQHLYFEQDKTSKEYKLDRAMKVLAMIAQVRDRNKQIVDFSRMVYGTNTDGKVLTTESEKAKHRHNREVIKRLKRYYNWCVRQIESF